MNKIYLDNAASTFPKPEKVIQAMNLIMKTNTSNAGRSGHKMSEEAEREIYEVRSAAADYFGIPGKEENVIFTSNATQAINTALFGVLKSGDNVIISDSEHNSVLRPLKELEKIGIKTDIASTDGNLSENIKELIKSDTKLIFITHASNVSGEIFPIREIGEICRKNNILFGVDTSQTAGHTEINVNECGIDLLCTSGHKGLYGPQGTGLLVLSDKVKEIKPLVFGGTGSNSLIDTQPNFLPDSLESGTLNGVGIVGLGEGINFCRRNGKHIELKLQNLTELCCDELRKINGVVLYSHPKNNAGIVSFSCGNLHSEAVAEYLNGKNIYVRGGFHCSYLFHHFKKTDKNGLVRVSFGAFTERRDINDLINSIKRLKLLK